MAAICPGEQPVMGVFGGRPPQQRLQQPVQVSRRAQIVPARDQADTLRGVILGGAQMITARRVLARQHHITEAGGVAGQTALTMFVPVQRAGLRRRARHVQPQREWQPGAKPGAHLWRGQIAAQAGIERSIRPLRRRCGGRDLPRDVGTGAEARIHQPPPIEPAQGGAILREMR